PPLGPARGAGPKVCGLPAGGRWIRTIGSASWRAHEVRPDSLPEGGVSCELVSEVKFASRAPNGSIPRGLGTILGAVERLFRARRGNNRAKPQHFRLFWMSISRLSNARARARAAGFPRAGRKSQRRRRDKRADQPFAKIKELFKKIKRLS